MKRVCGWCSRSMGETFGPDELVTHGICPDCMGKVTRDIRRRTGVCEIHGRYWPVNSQLGAGQVCPECEREIMGGGESKTFICDPTARDSWGFPRERDQLD
jgi:hypothetical protein